MQMFVIRNPALSGEGSVFLRNIACDETDPSHKAVRDDRDLIEIEGLTLAGNYGQKCPKMPANASVSMFTTA